MSPDLERWPSWLHWIEQKGSKVTEGTHIMCRLSERALQHACYRADALCSFQGHQHDVASERAASTHALCPHTFTSMASTLSLPDHPKALVLRVQIFEILCLDLHFWDFLKTTAEIPRPLEKGLILLHLAPDCKPREMETLQAYFPEIPVRAAPAISWLYTWPPNRTISSSKSICFLSVSSSLLFKYVIKSGTTAPTVPELPRLANLNYEKTLEYINQMVNSNHKSCTKIFSSKKSITSNVLPYIFKLLKRHNFMLK